MAIASLATLSPPSAGFFILIPKVSVQVFRFELTYDISHDSALGFGQRQVTLEELLIHIGNFCVNSFEVSDQCFFAAASKS